MKNFLYKKPRVSIKKIRFNFLRVRDPRSNIELAAVCTSCGSGATGTCTSGTSCSV